MCSDVHIGQFKLQLSEFSNRNWHEVFKHTTFKINTAQLLQEAPKKPNLS